MLVFPSSSLIKNLRESWVSSSALCLLCFKTSIFQLNELWQTHFQHFGMFWPDHEQFLIGSCMGRETAALHATKIHIKINVDWQECLNRAPHWLHDDVIKWKHFPHHWPFVNSPHQDQWRGALVFSLICARTNGWANNRDVVGLRRHRAYYYVTVTRLMCFQSVRIQVWRFL